MMVEAIWIASLGLISGIFINYLADYLPYKRRITSPICLNCGESIQLTRYLLWPRRCESCGYRRSTRTWVVEAIYVAIAMWLWFVPPARPGFALSFLLLVYFGLVAIIDLELRLILNPVSLVGAILGLAVGINLHGLRNTLIGGLAGFGVMLVLYGMGTIVMRLLARRRGRELEEEALGFGDVNLGGILGLILGWPGILLGLLLTILLAGLFSLVIAGYTLLRRSYRFDLAIPYGPFLISGAIALLFFRDFVMRALGW
jgi:leader peptidase (prepilin peptidase)/N-methyltransferase